VKSRHDKDVPGTSRSSKCTYTENGRMCGAPAHNIIQGKAEIFGKIINLKLMVCDTHMKEVQENDARYSTVGKDDLPAN
jgi:hypothetical protein